MGSNPGSWHTAEHFVRIASHPALAYLFEMFLLDMLISCLLGPDAKQPALTRSLSKQST